MAYMAELLSSNQAACDYLTGRWHDQVLDLNSVQHDEHQRKLRFVVYEEVPERKSRVVAFRGLGLFSVPIQSSVITVSPVEKVRVNCDLKERNLFITRLGCGPNLLRVEAMNGFLELSGDGMQVSLEALPDLLKGRRVLNFGLFEFSWPLRKTS